MNTVELSDLAYVLEQIKIVLNTASVTRYPKDKIQELKRRVGRLEEEFVKGVLSLDLSEFATEEDVRASVAESKSNVGLKYKMDDRAVEASRNIKTLAGMVTVTAPEDVVVLNDVPVVMKAAVDQVVESAGTKVKTKTAKVSKAKSVESDEDMDEFRRKLAEAKNKLPTKKKAD